MHIWHKNKILLKITLIKLLGGDFPTFLLLTDCARQRKKIYIFNSFSALITKNIVENIICQNIASKLQDIVCNYKLQNFLFKSNFNANFIAKIKNKSQFVKQNMFKRF